MIQPPLPDRSKLRLEPARNHIDSHAPLRINVDTSNLLRGYGGIPGSWQQGSDEFELLRREQQRLREAHGLVLVLGAVPGHKADLGQGIFETDFLGGLRVCDIGLKISFCALRDLAYYEAAGDIGDPVSSGVGVSIESSEGWWILKWASLCELDARGIFTERELID